MFKSFATVSVVAIAAASAGYASTLPSGSFSGVITTPASDIDPADILPWGDYHYAWESDVANPSTDLWIDRPDPSSVRWGATYDVYEDWGYFGDWDTSTAEVAGTSFEVDEVSELLGTISWTNRSNYLTGGDWSGSFTFELDFDGVAPIYVDVPFTMKTTGDPVDLTQTGWEDVIDNETTGLYPDDIVFDLGNLSFSEKVDLGGGVSLESLYFDLLTPGTPGEAVEPGGEFVSYPGSGGAVSFGSALEGSIWSNREGNTSVLGVYGRFAHDEVIPTPLPAGMWFLLAGVGGFAALKRRSKAEV